MVDKHTGAFFSVLVPVFNAGGYLDDCINSVLEQSYDNYEIILVDDGSTDDSGILCDSWQERYPDRIRVIHKQNEGLLYARWTGIQVAKGTYLLFLDSDDKYLPGALEKIHAMIVDTAADIVLFNLCGDRVDCSCDFSLLNGKTYLNGPECVEFFRMICQPLGFNSIVIKCTARRLFDDKDYIGFRGVDYGEDLFQSLPVLDRAKSIAILDEGLYYYRSNPFSMMHSFNQKRLTSLQPVFDRLCEYAKKWSEEFCEDLLTLTKNYAANECYSIVKSIVISDSPSGDKKKYFCEFVNSVFFREYSKYTEGYLRLYQRILYRMALSGNGLLWYVLKRFYIQRARSLIVKQ